MSYWELATFDAITECEDTILQLKFKIRRTQDPADALTLIAQKQTIKNRQALLEAALEAVQRAARLPARMPTKQEYGNLKEQIRKLDELREDLTQIGTIFDTTIKVLEYRDQITGDLSGPPPAPGQPTPGNGGN